MVLPVPEPFEVPEGEKTILSHSMNLPKDTIPQGQEGNNRCRPIRKD